MATRGKTNPEVALLIRRVEMDERFRVEVKGGANKVDILGPKGEPLILSLNAGSTDMRRAERSLERMGLRSDQPASPQVRQRVTTKPTSDPYPNITVYEKAKKVHKGATDYAKAKQVPIGLYDGVEYYIIDDKPLKYFIGKHYSRIQHYSGPGGTQEIYDFLRSTGNYARERQDDDTSAIIVRKEFADVGGPVQWRSPRGPVNDWQREQARKEAKLSAHEAGEDREPEPVTVTSIEARQAQQKADAEQVALDLIVAAGESEVIDLDAPVTDVPNPEDVRLLTEARARKDRLTCPECTDKPFLAKNPQGLAAHRKSVHGVEGTTYRPSVVGKIAPDSPLAEVGMAFDMLRDALGKITSEADHTSCQQEVEFQTADAKVQRERAERAEETLQCIWLAFSTMPQNKAVSEVLDLLPPLKD